MLIGQKYEIVRELGRGSFGVVYEARDLFLERIVAVKTVRDDRFPTREAREQFEHRFLREARSAARLSHPNVVAVFEAGRHQDSIYMAMEYVPGRTLQGLLAEKKRLTLAELLPFAEQLLRGLAYAHTHGVVHRDVKPANLLLKEDRALKISDFGTAKLLEEETVTLTRDGALMGTPSYMSPEQLLAKDVDGRSDGFAAAIVLYELLVGQRPFVADSVGGVVMKILSEEPPPIPAELGLAAHVEKAIRRQLSKEPAKRFSTCLELLEALLGRPAEGLEVPIVPVSANLVGIARTRAREDVANPSAQLIARRRQPPTPEEEPDLEGSLLATPAPEVLLDLRRRDAAGLLLVESGSFRLWLDIVKGLPVGASGGPPETVLGRILVRMGHVGEASYRRLLEQYDRVASTDPGMTMGSYLIRMGYATSAQVFQALEAQTDARVDAFIILDEGRYRFYEGVHTGAWDEMVPRPLEELLARALWREEARRRTILTTFLERHGQATVKTSDETMNQLLRFKLPPAVQRVLRRADGKSLKEAMEEGGGPGGEPALGLYLLWAAGALKLESLSRPGAAVVSRAAAPEELPPPPVYRVSDSSDFNPTLSEEEVNAEVKTKLQWAVEAMANREFDIAVDLLRTAHTLAPRDTTVLARLGWAVLRAHPESRAVQAEARSLLLEALRLDPRMVAALVALGKLSRWCGLRAEARAYLERALEVDPKNRQAKSELEQLGTESLKAADAPPYSQ